MEFADAVKSGFRKYITFSGRASRSDFWYWVLFVLLASVICVLIDYYVLGRPFAHGIIRPLFSLAVQVPGISVYVRRLHDINKSGWWFWMACIPLIGLIVILVWFCTKGTTGDNRFGPDPLAQVATGA